MPLDLGREVLYASMSEPESEDNSCERPESFETMRLVSQSTMDAGDYLKGSCEPVPDLELDRLIRLRGRLWISDSDLSSSESSST